MNRKATIVAVGTSPTTGKAWALARMVPTAEEHLAALQAGIKANKADAGFVAADNDVRASLKVDEILEGELAYRIMEREDGTVSLSIEPVGSGEIEIKPPEVAKARFVRK
jgi:hypothetical protein